MVVLSPNFLMLRHSPCHTLISFLKKSYHSLSDSKFLILILPPTTMVQESRCVTNGGDGCGIECHPHDVEFDKISNLFIPNIHESIPHNVSSMEDDELRCLCDGHWASKVY